MRKCRKSYIVKVFWKKCEAVNGMRRERAMALFEEGYNCAQSVFLAFSDLHGMDTHTAAALSSSFGGGMGRLREVCGAVSGMFLVAGTMFQISPNMGCICR